MWLHSYPEGSTVSRYQTFKQVEKSLGREPAELRNRPPFRDVLYNALSVFNSLKTVSYQELQAYIQITGNWLEWWEVEAITKLDGYRGDTSWQPKQQR